jgi:hypothetical protein
MVEMEHYSLEQRKKMMCDTYGLNPRLLPLSKNENLKLLKNIAE